MMPKRSTHQGGTKKQESSQKADDKKMNAKPSEKDPKPIQAAKPPSHREDRSDDDNDESSSEEDEDLVLEGVLIRNLDVLSSESDDDDYDDDDNDDDEPPPPKRKAGPPEQAASKFSNNKRKKAAEPEILQVEFTFHDMNEKFFHGIKTLLQSTGSIYASQASPLSDLMIENVSVGTVVSTEGDEEGTVFGFASVLNVSKHKDNPCIQYLKDLCLKNPPPQHKAELETVLSGTTRRPAGFLIHSRMINLPLEIVQVLHEQLVQDMDWAVEHAHGGEDERKALDFGAFVRLAPCTPASAGDVVYKFFDDEVMATHAEFVCSVDVPKSFGEEKQLCNVIVMTKTGHRAAMQDLKKMISGA